MQDDLKNTIALSEKVFIMKMWRIKYMHFEL